MIVRCRCGAQYNYDLESEHIEIRKMRCEECGVVGELRCTHNGAMHGECECGLDLSEHHDNDEEV